MRRVAIITLLLVGAFLAQARSALHAADVFWNNPAGGTFSDGANWAGGKAPTTADGAFFDTHSSPIVNFSANALTGGLEVNTADVSFNLNGNSYAAIGPANPDGCNSQISHIQIAQKTRASPLPARS